MPLLALLSPTLLALSLGSLSVLGQQQWNTSNDRSDAAALVTLPITRFGLPGFDFTIEDAVRSDQNRVNWLYETAIERGNDELFGPSDDSAVAGGNATAGVLRSRASTSDTNLANVVVSDGPSRMFTSLMLLPVRLRRVRGYWHTCDVIWPRRGHRLSERLDPQSYSAWRDIPAHAPIPPHRQQGPCDLCQWLFSG
jgi:hypothetical protein